MSRPVTRLLGRRSFLGAVAGWSLAGRAWPAAESNLPIPAVESVTLQMVVDNSTFGPFLPDENLPGLQVIRSLGGTAAGRLVKHPLLAEFGLSVHAESKLGGETKRVLVDFGYSPEVLHNNLTLLHLDPTVLDASVLSHGHLDHYGGFPGLFEGRETGGKKLPLVVGGEEAFCERLALVGNPPPVMGTLDRADLAKAGFDVRVAASPQLLGGHAFTTGTIALSSFERAAIPTQMKPGIGCESSLLSPAKRKAQSMPDDGEHELATCFVLKNRGLVVIASCSHRGILNSIRQAQQVSGVTKVHAVVGGFHLVRPRTEEEARRTVAELVKIDPTYVAPMHCTGEVFMNEALKLMPQKVIRPYVGNKLVMGQA